MEMERKQQAAWEVVFDYACVAHRNSNYMQAERLYSIALASAVNLSLNNEKVANLFYQMGLLYKDQNCWQKAEQALVESLIMLDTSKTACDIDKAMALRELSEILRYQNKYRQSSLIAAEAYRLIQNSRAHLEKCLAKSEEDAPSTNKSTCKRQVFHRLIEWARGLGKKAVA